MATNGKAATRERLHQLIDEIPDDEIGAAKSYLEYLRIVGSSRLYRTLIEAPLDDEPETDEERTAVEEARADLAAGRVVPHEQVMREVLGRD